MPRKKTTPVPAPTGVSNKLTPALVHGFVSSLLIKNFDDPSSTPECHMEWWDLCCSDAKQVALAAPRGHAKSSALTISYALAASLFRAHDYTLIVSDSVTQASEFLRNIKEELAENEALKELFGIAGFLKDTEHDIIMQCRDGHKFRISAKGSEQKLRGLLWRKKRPNLIVVDDAENDEIVMNDDRRVKFREWFFSALIPSLSKDGKIRIVGTILHMDSLLERLMPPVGDPAVKEEPLKSYWADNTGHSWKAVRYRAHTDDFSHILWGSRYDKDFFIARRRDFQQQGMPEKYNQEYLNYPIDDATAYFRRDDFATISNPDEHLVYYIGCDLAISEKKKSAYTAMAVCGVNHQGKLRVVDMRRFRGDAYDIINELFSLNHEYAPECIFIEQENIARALGAVLDREMYERNEFLSIEPIQPSADKVQRSRSFQARMRAGAVEWDMDADWFQAAFNELITFPRGVYKDQVDALSLIGLGINKVWEAKQQEEIEQEREADFERQVMEGNTMNVWTGY